MDYPGQPHVRTHERRVYVERVPSAWVEVCDAELWMYLLPHERTFVIEQAVKHGIEKELTREVPHQ